jgi:hypothetical protein
MDLKKNSFNFIKIDSLTSPLYDFNFNACFNQQIKFNLI